MSARLLALAALLVAAIFPFLPGIPAYWVTVASTIGLSAIVALGIVVLTGVAAVVSFGQAMFVGFGAYTTAILSARHGWHPLATLPVALALTGLLAWGIGAITLRLRGHYLPVATIAWNISFFYLTGGLDVFGRHDGISAIPPITVGGLSFAGGTAFYWLVLAVLAAATILTANLLDSRVGRAIRSLRGGVLAAESCGVDTGRARILAFVYAALLAAMSGWLYAHFQRAINPSPFSINASIDYLLMAVAGGVGHIGGAILGAGLVTVVRDKLQDVLPLLIGAQGNFEAIVFGFVLIGILQFAPEGLWPHLRRFWPGRSTSQRRHAEEAAEQPSRSTHKVGASPDHHGGASFETRPAGAPQDDERGSFGPESQDDAVGRFLLEAGDALLTVTGLRKTFGGLVAVDDLSFDVRAGEIVGLIGPNGAGKSTSFNLVTGLLPASAGAIRFRGEAIDGWPSRQIARLGLARTFQHVKLVHGMSVLDNVAIGAHLDGHAGPLGGALRLDRAEEARLFAKARTALARVGLGDHAHTVASELALGQQRLVEIARALAADPVMLLLDEPAAGLRHAEKTALAALLRELRADGLAVLLVEHDMDFVMGLTDRLVVMNFGSELARGRPAEIQRNPAVLEAYLGAPA